MSDRPNILLLLSDQHSPHLLGCAGEPIVRTPHLDRLAAEGVRFSDVSCGNPLCVPSRMSFLTSRDCSAIGVWTNGCQLGSQHPTFVHHLVNAGYDSTLCGRMHFVGQDQRHGYERRIIGDVHAFYKKVPPSTCGQMAAGVRPAGPGITSYKCYDDAVTENAKRFLENWDESPGERPFFMTVGWVLPHCPYICPKPLFDEYYPQVEPPALPPGYHDRLHPFLKQWRQTREVDTLTDEEVRVARAAYYGLVTYTDQMVGDILATLARTRYADNTVVIYTSDHGEMAGEHRMWWKSSFFQGSVGVPAIWHWPGRFAAGQTVDAVTSLLDIGPTLVDIAGGDPMPRVRGRSLASFLNGQGAPDGWQDVVYSEYGGLQGDAPGRMVRQGPWKLNHYHGHDRPELYHLGKDPGEWHDLGADPAYAEIRGELEQMVLDGWSGEAVLRASRQIDSDLPVLRQYNQTARRSRTDPPDRWTAPEDCEEWPME